ncbi:hypothetical protein BFP71_11115 [Roseivirga misakiensis]|uniref:Guanylate cyclase domain-containing protein n=1 Tax=Roseivirga misakiensis TaxID=1563681 RepID=A0A1E5T2P3_9BACT|nr:hypothetical protein BFP71_11115 [Roseivirga misakiensis]
MIWLLMSWVFLFVEYAAAGWKGAEDSGVIALTPRIVAFSTFAVFFVGLGVGLLEVFFLDRLFKKYSLGRKVIFKFVFYFLFAHIIIFIFYPLAGAVETGASPLDDRILEKFSRFLVSVNFISTMVQLSFSLVVSLLYAAVSDSLGQNVLINFFTGKYHTPKKEERIFMFLDMRDSTTIAEKLGHVKYFELLGKYYQTMSDAIIKSYGEVYQYIGDEVVISWPIKRGLEKSRCVKCFFYIQNDFLKQAETFKKQFGVFPGFKAGMHMGEVTTGEVGALKTEIVFTGDVLNTTARIQSLCNQYKAELLISKDLYTQLEDYTTFQFHELGSMELKGKQQQVSILGVAHPS